MTTTTKAFVDESARRGYLICAVVVAIGDLEAVRRNLRKLRKPGATRIHMATERPAFRRELLSAVSRMPVRAHIYEAELATRSQRAARDDCLHALVSDLVTTSVGHVTFESCDQDLHDRSVIASALRKMGDLASLNYAHLRPTEDELL